MLTRRSETDQIDTFRCLLLEDQASHDLNMLDDLHVLQINVAVGTIEWLWMNAGNTFVGTNWVIFRSLLLRTLVARYCRNGTTADTEDMGDALTDQIVRLVDAEMRRHLMSGEIGLIESLFFYQSTSIESQRIGKDFIDLLERLGLEFNACIEMELANLPDRLLKHYAWNDSRRRKIVVEYRQDGDSALRWVWVFDPQEHGYLLASEFVSLGADSRDLWLEWPFYTADYIDTWQSGYSEGEKCNRRRSRREATKARKERARAGRKRPKSKMPGSWNW
ncbi:hypothetical protein BKA63DRAFT_274913 [Paraphoma chrysanthemicola]|nr:hypothetical protein BKA63DRAFT_274913 [Paraphoma chrysanthemicola]